MYLEQLYREVYLAFPDGIPRRERFCDLFVHIINKIPADFAVKLFVRDSARFERQFKPRLHRSVEAIELGLSDIWLGDFFPYRFDQDTVFTFQYADYQADQKLLMDYLARERIDKLPLKLDLGSFEVIDDVLLLSPDVFENNDCSIPRIKRILKDYFEYTRLVVLDAGTRLNHIDTMIRVFDDILLYNSIYVTPAMLAQLKDALARQCYHFFDLPFRLTGAVNDHEEDHVESYVGNAFDFIVLGDTLLFPVVQDQDRKSLASLRAILKKQKNAKNIVVIEHRDLEGLYALGGGLFCISGLY